MLTNILKKLYLNNQCETIALLTKYGLISALEPVISKILELDLLDFERSKKQLGIYSSSFLIKVNLVLEKITNEQEKREIEYILNDLFKELFFQIVQKTPKNLDLLILEIVDSLKIVCETYGWNYGALENLIRLELTHTITARTSTDTSIQKIDLSNKIYFVWDSQSEKALSELIHSLKDMKTIKSISEFRYLFHPELKKIKVRINAKSLDLFVVLFSELKRRGLIKMKGSRGHLEPLKLYCCDFDKKELFKSEPKYLHDLIKKKPSKHKELLEKVDLLLRHSGFRNSTLI